MRHGDALHTSTQYCTVVTLSHLAAVPEQLSAISGAFVVWADPVGMVQTDLRQLAPFYTLLILSILFGVISVSNSLSTSQVCQLRCQEPRAAIDSPSLARSL